MGSSSVASADVLVIDGLVVAGLVVARLLVELLAELVPTNPNAIRGLIIRVGGAPQRAFASLAAICAPPHGRLVW